MAEQLVVHRNYDEAEESGLSWPRIIGIAFVIALHLAALMLLLIPAVAPKADADQERQILVTLVEAWEARHYPIGAPDPVEAIRFRMEQGGLTVKDLVPSIGQPNRVYEVLNRKRGLTLEMVRKLHRNLGIPAESLIGV